LPLLHARENNVEEELEVNEINMKSLRRLVVSFDGVVRQALRRCRDLVEEVGLGSVPEIWEVEI